MLRKPIRKLIASLAALALCSASALAQEKKEKKVQDAGEYEIYTAATKETDLNKKVQLLLQWKEKYPTSDYKEDVRQMIATTYYQLGNGEKAWEASKDLLTLNPKNFVALYFLTVLVQSMGNTAPDRLQTGEMAAKGLLAVLAEMNKPEAYTQEQWKKERFANEVLATRTLGWIEMSRKSFDKSEEIFTNFLKMKPNSGQVSYWLATSMLQQKKPEKQIPAIYHLARAANYSGEEALPDTAKKQLQEFLERTYVKFTGRKDGLQELIQQALKEPFPPTDFAIESEAQRIVREKEKLRQEDPQKYLWVGLKEGLIDPANGQTYWDGTLKGSGMPKLKGKVVSANPPARPKELTVGIMTPDVAEIRLRLDNAHGAKVDPGTELEFEGGVAAEFAADPFLLTIDQEKEKVSGLPAAPVRGAPKGGGKKGAAKGKRK